MENTEQLDQCHITRNSGNEKADVWNVINTCRDHKKFCTVEQVVEFMSRLKDNSNIKLFLQDIPTYTKGIDHTGLISIMSVCKFNKAKRECCEFFAPTLPEDTTDEQKEEVAAVITGAFERNKARKCMGLE